MTSEPDALAKAWKAHEEAMRIIREHLAKDGATLQVDIVIRDKAATERHERRRLRR